MTVIDKGKTDWNEYTDPYFQEIIDARGSAADLDTRLSVSLHADGTLKTTTTAAWWAEEGSTVSYVSATTFTISGDKTSVYSAKQAIKAAVTAGSVYAHVSSVSYDSGTGLTTVVLDDSVLDSGLSTIYYGQPVNSDPENDLSSYAPLASPAFTGTPTAPTPTAGDDSTKVATTEYVQGEVPVTMAHVAVAGSSTTSTSYVAIGSVSIDIGSKVRTARARFYMNRARNTSSSETNYAYVQVGGGVYTTAHSYGNNESSLVGESYLANATGTITATLYVKTTGGAMYWEDSDIIIEA